MQDSRPGRVVARSRGKRLDVLGDAVHITLRGEDTGGAYALVEIEARPGCGPPLHVHRREDEAFFVLEGEFEFTVAGGAIRAGEGAAIFGPRGVPHTFRCVGPRPGRLLATLSPPGFEEFFEEVQALAKKGPPPPQAAAEIAARYGVDFLPTGAAC
jgi:quercetin dioxygenase-like cupin family protein